MAFPRVLHRALAFERKTAEQQRKRGLRARCCSVVHLVIVCSGKLLYVH